MKYLSTILVLCLISVGVSADCSKAFETDPVNIIELKREHDFYMDALSELTGDVSHTIEPNIMVWHHQLYDEDIYGRHIIFQSKKPINGYNEVHLLVEYVSDNRAKLVVISKFTECTE